MNESQVTIIEVPLELLSLSTGPALSRTDSARIYNDAVSGLMASIAGAAYVALGSGAGGPPTGPAGGALSGTYPNPSLANVGPGATGPLGDASHSVTITINAKGQVTAFTVSPIQIAESQVTNLTTDLAALQPLSAVLTALASVMSSTATAAAQRTALGLGTIATQAASGVTITGGSVTGITDLAVADGGTGASTAAAARSNLGADAYDIGFFAAGAPTASQIVLVFTATRAIVLPTSLTGSKGSSITAATSQTDFDIQVNGVSKGTIRFAGAATTCSFIFASPVTLAAGDIVKIVAPASPDATLANIGVTLLGTF